MGLMGTRSTAALTKKAFARRWENSNCVLPRNNRCSFRLRLVSLRNQRKKQESLANAKVSARQPWYIGRNSLNRLPLRIAQQYQRNLCIVEKYFQRATIFSLTVWDYLHSFSCCCLPNMPTSAKFPENLNLQQFKVIQGRWFWYQSKAHIRVPISD